MNKFLLALAFFYFTSSYAQITFEKGYFINNNDVRINCYIENMDWNNNPKSFTYKLLENDQPKQEDFTGVREFGINNVSMYKRFTLNMERSTYETGQLTPNKNPIFKKETLFLKALIIGDASLYVWTGDNLVKYFFETKSLPIEQLIYIRYTVNEGYNISENNLFRQQLLNSLKCGDLSEKDFKNLKYNANGLSDVIKKYNTCANKNSPVTTTVDFFEKKKRKSFLLKITPGVAAASLSITDPSIAYNVSTDQNGVVFKIGAELEYLLPFNKNTWSMFINPTYQKFESENTYTKFDVISNNSYLNHTATTDYSSIEIPIGVRRYFFLNTNSRIFINAAYVIDISVGDSKIEFKNAEKINANKQVSISSRNNFAAGAGFSYKKLSAEIRINTPREILGSYISWSGKYSTLGVVVGYTIF